MFINITGQVELKILKLIAKEMQKLVQKFRKEFTKNDRQRLEEYFEVNKSVASNWRKKSFPERRLKEFSYREGTLDTEELFSRIYS